MNSPAPAYLLLGPESGNKAKRIREIRALCKACNGDTDAELHRFYPFETEQGEILAALQNTSLFADHRLVLLAEAENLKAAQAQMIAEYLKHPSESATLVITSANTSVHASLMKAVPKEQKQIFWELFENQKKDWLIDYFRTRSIDISLEAVELMLSLIENNTQELRVVSQQLAAYMLIAHEDDETAGQVEITEDDVETFIYHSRQESVFTLFDHIAARKLEEALEVLRAIELSRDTDPIGLFGGLLWQFRRLYSYMSIIEDGDTEQDGFNGATVLGKSSAIRGKHNQHTYRSAAKEYNLKDVEHIISFLCDTDKAVREMGTAIQPMLIERLIHTIIKRKGTPTTAADAGLAALYL
ncbi:MAG: DNA polymerase III subunit delta [Spirochaetia bacterium]|nr:DNA polymerase III subunit delta [Spirochaetia bacterium]MCF7940093.1 DNA polymerase III subunit delta [Spirochaetia bacterium]